MKPLLIAIWSTIAIASMPVKAEYFGEFPDTLKGTFVTNAKPRPIFKLEADFRFKDPNGLVWITPANEEVDGATIPQEFWSFIGGPFEGQYLNASVIHDHYCKTKSRTAHDTHRAFYYGMMANRVPEWKAKFMYWAVSLFGPDWALTKRATSEPMCMTINTRTLCRSTITLAETMVDKNRLDLADPLVLAMALSKAEAVARSLKTTNGRTLDISSKGEVTATLDNIVGNSMDLKLALAPGVAAAEPDRLGVLAEWQNKNLDDVIPWKHNKMPTWGNTIILTKDKNKPVEAGRSFRVDKNAGYLVIDQVQNNGMSHSIANNNSIRGGDI